MKKDSEWFDLNIKKKVGWLSEPLKGKMKGIQEAAKLFEMSFKYPEYDRLTILELINKLKESDEEIIENAAWMLLKLAKLKPKLLFENLKTIKNPIKIKNKKIRIFLGSIIKELAQIDSSRVQTAVPQIIELLDDSNEDVKLLGSQIFLIISKTVREKIEVSKQLALLNEKNSQIRLNAVETLINISESKKTTPILYEKLFILILYPQLKARVFNLIFQLIDKDPEESLKFIKNQLNAKKLMIRRNTLLFMTQYLGRKLDYLTNAINELVEALFGEYDKKNLQMLFSILIELSEFYPQKFTHNHFKGILEQEKVFKKDFRKEWIRILLNLLKNQEEPIFNTENIKKFLEKQVNKGDYENRFKASVSLNKILMWSDDYGPAIKTLLKIIEKYPLEDNGEILFWIGFNYHVIGDYRTAIPYFLKGIKSKLEYFSSLSLLYGTYDYLITFKVKKAKELLQENENRWDSNLNSLSLIQKGILLRFYEYLNAIIRLNNDRAKENLNQYLSKCYFSHPWDKRYSEVERKNLEDIIKHYKKLENLNV